MKEEAITQKVGEVLIIGPPGANHRKLLTTVCPRPQKSEQNMEFGRMEIDSDLALFLYAITYNQKKPAIAWDLIARKMLGVIIMFNWADQESLQAAKHILDFFNAKFEAPCVLAADVPHGALPVNKKIAFPYISLSPREKFLFCNSNSGKSMKLTLATLINLVSNYAV